MKIEGPSGFSCNARKFAGNDIQQAADELEDSESLSDKAMCRLLTNCFEGVIDPGPYDIGENEKPNFYNKILKGDVVALLLSLRVGSFKRGAEYGYKVRCQDMSCREPISWYTDIAQHVLSRTRPLSAESSVFMRDGSPIEVMLERESGEIDVVGFQLMTLQREEPARKFIKTEIKRKQRKTKSQLLADRIASQLLELNGEKIPGMGQRMQWARALPMEELYHLRDEFDKHDCEVDTVITVKCPACSWEFDTTLPFGPTFLDPTILSRRERLFGLPGEDNKSTSISEDSAPVTTG